MSTVARRERHDGGTMQIAPIERFAQSGAAIKRPVEIAAFSYDAARAQHHDARGLRYYYTPPPGASLSRGFEDFRRADESRDEHLDGLLSSLVHLEQLRDAAASANSAKDGPGEAQVDGGVEEITLTPDFVTWRGMMTKILTTPYDNRDGFAMNATMFQVFIEESHEFKTAQKQREKTRWRSVPGKPDQELMAYWGYKFEALSLLPQTWDATPREYIEAREDHIVGNVEQYISVVQTGIAGTRIILGGEVDGIWDGLPTHSDPPDEPSPPRRNYVELKTSAELTPGPAGRARFEAKLLRIWAQSFLLGVPRVIVGFRSNDMQGRLLRIEEFATTGIPKLVREQGAATWDSSVCINFAASFLQFLKDIITRQGVQSIKENGGGVWKIHLPPNSKTIHVEKVADSGTGRILSQEFLTWRRTRDSLETAKARLLDRVQNGE